MCVVGLGRVGLPAAVLFAQSGLCVVGADVSEPVRRRVAGGEPGPEPGVTAALRAALEAGRLRVVEHPVPARSYVISVPTPLDAMRRADLTDVRDAVVAVSCVAPAGALVMLQSTVPVGTTDAMATTLRSADPTLLVAHCPERVLPGRALQELVGNDRVVGGVDPNSTASAAALWASVCRGTILETDARTAELTKLVENASRDVELALANSVAHVAEQHGLDPGEVRDLVNRHPRVSLLQPGPGVGGHCIPVDPWFLMSDGVVGTDLFAAARGVNDAVVDRVVGRIREAAGEGGRIGLLGLAYKPDVDDARNSPALAIARRLAEDRRVVVTDPFVVPPSDLSGVSLSEAMAQDLVVLVVAHGAYRDAGPPRDREWMDLCGGWR